MWQVENHSPYSHHAGFRRDQNGRTLWILTIKASFEIRHGRALRHLQPQPDLRQGPEVDGDRFLADGEVTLPRPMYDLILTGHAHAPDPIIRELCSIFCETRDEWHKCKRSGAANCRRPSALAKDKIDRQLASKGSGLRRALGNRIGAAERAFYATADKIFDGVRKIYDRSGLERAIKRQVEKLLQRKVVKQGAKLAGRAWLKLVPGLNVLSTIYDVVDTAMTAAEVYDMIKSSNLIMDKAIKIQPDFAVMDQDGALQDIYDFKFDDPVTGYQDDWQSAQKQQEAYERALGGSKQPRKVDNATCQCDKTPAASGVRMM